MNKQSIPPQRGFFPQPSYIIGALASSGQPNFILITWLTFCSITPPLLMFASRGEKLTPKLIRETGEFSANLATSEMLSLADYFGVTSGFQVDKAKDTQVKWSLGAALSVPVLEQSPWVFECKLINTVPQGDGTIYIGEVKNIQASTSLPDTNYGKVDLAALDPLIYGPSGYYALSKKIGSVGDSKLVYPLRRER